MAERERIDIREIDGEPTIRVGVYNNQSQVDFIVDHDFSIYDIDDNLLVENAKANVKWRLKLKERKPGKFQYRLVLLETHDEVHVDAILKKLKKNGVKAEKMEIGGHLYFRNKYVTENTRFLILADVYDDWFEAHKEMRKYQPEYTPYVFKASTKPPYMRIELFDAEYKNSLELEGPVKIVPNAQESRTKLFDIYERDPVLQKDLKHHYYLDGSVEFNSDDEGMISIINELPFYKYLERAVVSEVGEGMPLEFVKAMTVVSRSEALVRYSLRHENDNYDFCATPHCLRYFGHNYKDKNIARAIKETRGQVIYDDLNVCDAYFHLISGGHTEDAAGIWQDENDAFFKGTYDYHTIDEKYEDLRDEDVIRKWIADRPDVYCNLAGMSDLPENLRENKKFFRWQIEYSRQELESIVEMKTGIDVGTIFDIIPIKRGRSGRLIEIEILGSLKNMRIRGELNIRMTLAPEYMYSSCFVIDKELSEDGTPISFSFAGAGHGHGVGLCKTGAAVMALDGKDYKNILAHYFAQGKIKSIFD
jgi:stage II sporulation protein D